MTTQTLIQINTPYGRFYQTPEGNIYPSVTTVTGLLTARHINDWKKRVGDKVAEQISKEASEHGTRWHELLESKMNDSEGQPKPEPQSKPTKETAPQPQKKATTLDELKRISNLGLTKIKETKKPEVEFSNILAEWERKVKPHISDVRGIELPLYSNELRIAGTVDLVASWDGIPSIIDWKTTRHYKSPNDIANYWCQTAAYAQAVKERLGYLPKQSVIVFNKSDSEIFYYTASVEKWLPVIRKLRLKYDELKPMPNIDEWVNK